MSSLVECLDVLGDRFETLGIVGHDIQSELVLVECHTQKDAEHEASHELLKVKLGVRLGQVCQQPHEDIQPVMQGLGDVSLKVLLAERPRGRLALHLPLLAVGDEDA